MTKPTFQIFVVYVRLLGLSHEPAEFNDVNNKIDLKPNNSLIGKFFDVEDISHRLL